MALIPREPTLCLAAAKAGMDEKTARKYRRSGQLPSEVSSPPYVADASRPIRRGVGRGRAASGGQRGASGQNGVRAPAASSIRVGFRMVSCARYSVA